MRLFTPMLRDQVRHAGGLVPLAPLSAPTLRVRTPYGTLPRFTRLVAPSGSPQCCAPLEATQPVASGHPSMHSLSGFTNAFAMNWANHPRVSEHKALPAAASLVQSHAGGRPGLEEERGEELPSKSCDPLLAF